MTSCDASGEFVVDPGTMESGGGERFWSERAGEPLLVIDETAVRAAARKHAPGSSVLLVFLRQKSREFGIRLFGHKQFRARSNRRSLVAYCRMSKEEFVDINALQSWASWRTIPRNLTGRVPRRPLAVIDLCSGIGESTQVLAYHCPPGSQIIGLEFNRRFVRAARERLYLNRHGVPADVQFHGQSILEPFCEPNGRLIADRSIDLVNAIGALGSHFKAESTIRVAGECARVIRSGGLAMLDAGPDGTSVKELTCMMSENGFRRIHQSKSCALERNVQVCFRKVSREKQGAADPS